MNKGYIIPIVLIVLLLVLAGFFVMTPTQNQKITETTPPKATTTVPILEEDIEDVTDVPATTTETDSNEVTPQEETATSTEVF